MKWKNKEKIKRIYQMKVENKFWDVIWIDEKSSKKDPRITNLFRMWFEPHYSLHPTLALASHYKPNKVLLILDFVLVYISGERDEKQTYDTCSFYLRSYVYFIFV